MLSRSHSHCANHTYQQRATGLEIKLCPFKRGNSSLGHHLIASMWAYRCVHFQLLAQLFRFTFPRRGNRPLYSVWPIFWFAISFLAYLCYWHISSSICCWITTGKLGISFFSFFEWMTYSLMVLSLSSFLLPSVCLPLSVWRNVLLVLYLGQLLQLIKQYANLIGCSQHNF